MNTFLMPELLCILKEFLFCNLNFIVWYFLVLVIPKTKKKKSLQTDPALCPGSHGGNGSKQC